MAKILLTVDDIPDEVTIPLLDYLLEQGIRPVMFTIGDLAEKNYDTLLYVLKKGIVVGNHSWTHPDFSTISYEECIEEIERTEALLNKAYADAGVERRYKLFRFPFLNKGGENKEKLQQYLRDKGFTKVDDRGVTAAGYIDGNHNNEIDTCCSYDIMEYMVRPGQMTIDDIIKRLDRDEPGQDIIGDSGEHLVLFHSHKDTDVETPGYYKTIIGHLLERGAEFVEPKML